MAYRVIETEIGAALCAIFGAGRNLIVTIVYRRSEVMAFEFARGEFGLAFS